MSAYQTIHEKIAVAGVYAKGVFTPKKFSWRGTVLPVEQVTLQADLRDGQAKLRQFAVVSGGTVYRLLFHRESETWFLEEVWCE